MFVLSFIRYIRGYVEFCVRGVFIERFLNLAARDRIPVWDGRKRGGVFTGKTIAGSYRGLRRHAKKTGVRLRVVKKHGAPFKRHRYRRRTGLLLGFGIFFAFLFAMSRFIWRVEVSGNDRVSEVEIIEALEQLDVKPGRLRSSIDVRGAERRALLMLDDLSWIALNIQGSALRVAVRESEPAPVMIDPNTPCNVTAAKSGQIVSMVVYDGEPLKAIGDTVLKGDVIVSGITEDRLGQNLFRHARAKAVARVQERLVAEAPLSQLVYEETGEVKTRRFLHVFGWDLPFFWPTEIQRPYHVERGRSMLRVLGAELPVGIFTEKFFLMSESPVTYTESQAKQLALKELSLLEKASLGDAELVEKTAVGSLSDGVFTITADYVCLMDIAVEKEIHMSE